MPSNSSKTERYSYPYTGLDKTSGLQDVKATRIFRQSANQGG